MRADIQMERDRAWFTDPTIHYNCPGCGRSVRDIARTSHNIGFDRGVKWAIRRTTELSPHIAKFVELMTWLSIQDESFVKVLKRIVLGEVTGEVIFVCTKCRKSYKFDFENDRDNYASIHEQECEPVK